MPVLPDVASRMPAVACEWPAFSASQIMRAAGRSLTDPPGLSHSAFAYSSTPENVALDPRQPQQRRLADGVEDGATRSRLEGVTRQRHKSDLNGPIYHFRAALRAEGPSGGPLRGRPRGMAEANREPEAALPEALREAKAL